MCALRLSFVACSCYLFSVCYMLNGVCLLSVVVCCFCAVVYCLLVGIRAVGSCVVVECWLMVCV